MDYNTFFNLVSDRLAFPMNNNQMFVGVDVIKLMNTKHACFILYFPNT